MRPSPSPRTVASAVAVLAGAVAAALLWAAPAGAQCGQEFRGRPASSSVPGGPPLAIGDSVLADAVGLLVREGFEADGMVCRQMSQGIQILAERGASLPHLVVVALGANGEVTSAQIDEALALVGPHRVLALVTPHGGPDPADAPLIRSEAARHPGRIVLLDWDRLAAEHRDWLAPDGVHLGSQSGIDGFTALVASALSYARSASAPAPAPATIPAPETTTPGNVGAPVTIQPKPARPGAAQAGTSSTATAVPATTPGSTRPAGAATGAADSAHTRGSSAGTPVIGWIALGLVVLGATAAAVWRVAHRRRAAGH